MRESEKIAFAMKTTEILLRILKRGNSAEVKKENNKLVIVEIERRVRDKNSIIG